MNRTEVGKRAQRERTYFKVLGTEMESIHGGYAAWEMGKWQPRVTDVELCSQGYHLVPLGHISDWLNARIFVAEGRGVCDWSERKVAFAQARIVAETAWSLDSVPALMRDLLVDLANHPLAAEYRPRIRALVDDGKRLHTDDWRIGLMTDWARALMRAIESYDLHRMHVDDRDQPWQRVDGARHMLTNAYHAWIELYLREQPRRWGADYDIAARRAREHVSLMLTRYILYPAAQVRPIAFVEEAP